ncbi:MAG: YkgJ family cysteine cluster protein [Dehalococcoidia bacterium]
MLRFECTRCGDCCRGPGRARVSPVDIQRLARHLGLSVDGFVARYTEQVVYTAPGLAPTQPELVLSKAGEDCIFLQGDECSVHAAKPDGCRLGPFTFGILGSDRNWAHFQRICPGLDQGPAIPWQSVQESLDDERRLRAAEPRTTEEVAARLGIQPHQLPPLQTILLTESGSLPDVDRGDAE